MRQLPEFAIGDLRWLTTSVRGSSFPPLDSTTAMLTVSWVDAKEASSSSHPGTVLQFTMNHHLERATQSAGQVAGEEADVLKPSRRGCVRLWCASGRTRPLRNRWRRDAGDDPPITATRYRSEWEVSLSLPHPPAQRGGRTSHKCRSEIPRAC